MLMEWKRSVADFGVSGRISLYSILLLTLLMFPCHAEELDKTLNDTIAAIDLLDKEEQIALQRLKKSRDREHAFYELCLERKAPVTEKVKKDLLALKDIVKKGINEKSVRLIDLAEDQFNLVLDRYETWRYRCKLILAAETPLGKERKAKIDELFK